MVFKFRYKCKVKVIPYAINFFGALSFTASDRLLGRVKAVMKAFCLQAK